MPAIEQICLSADWRVADLWPALAQGTLQWMSRCQVAPRDAIVLLPFAALLAPARAAFAELGGWQPRVETALTLAASLGPPAAAEPGLCSGDPVLDHLSARALMQRQAWAQQWAHSDPAGFERLVVSVVDAAHALRTAAHQRAPQDRADFWAQARGSLAVPVGPAAAEALLLQVALEWAAQSAPAPTDRLHALRPSAWVLMQLGGPDAVAESLAALGRVPALRWMADAPDDEPFDGVSRLGPVRRWLCEDFEGEAQAAAAEVFDALNAGRTPVALVALDRELVRRIRALLERDAVPLVDETGWVLATTRAAATVLALLRSAASSAPRDTLLDWLKAWPSASPRALQSLEALWRERRRVPDREAALALWDRARLHLKPLSDAGTLPLADWLQCLHGVLDSDGSLVALQGDPAGAQVLAALHLGDEGSAAWQQAAAQARWGLAGFTAWVQATLEQAPYLPLPDPGAVVVLTPLSRAFGRPFGHVVLPAAEHRHLGSSTSPPSLIGDTWAAALGMDHAAARRQRQQAALGHLLRAGGLSLLRRHRNDDEPLAESPLVEWLLLCRERAGEPAWPLQAWHAPTVPRPRRPVSRPLPQAPEALPAVLSASQLEALRACPYRFFARAVLRLDEADELDTGLAKRDYGNWLHAVLHRFHSERVYASDPAAQLHDAASFVTQDMALDDGDMLPWRASFESLVPAYLAWCAQREAQGWYWADGESDHQRAPPELAGLRLRGRVDRVDHGPDGQQQLLDYKTGSLASLTAKTRDPLEDTQLAFYAALLGGGEALGAAYVALDSADAPREVPHDQVHATAATLLQGLGDEWQRLRDGAAMPALGEGAVCETCESRGLCRRDHWSPA